MPESGLPSGVVSRLSSNFRICRNAARTACGGRPEVGLLRDICQRLLPIVARANVPATVPHQISKTAKTARPA